MHLYMVASEEWGKLMASGWPEEIARELVRIAALPVVVFKEGDVTFTARTGIPADVLTRSPIVFTELPPSP